MRHGFKLGESEFDIGLSRAHAGYRLHIGDREVPVDLTTDGPGNRLLRCGKSLDEVIIATHGDDIYIHLDGATHHLRYEHPLQRLAELREAVAGDTIYASMPGSLIALEVAERDCVSQGQTLLIIESMKMETTFAAPRDGVVQRIHVETGVTFNKGDALLTLEPEAREPEAGESES